MGFNWKIFFLSGVYFVRVNETIKFWVHRCYSFSGGIMENLIEQLQKNVFDKQENLEVTLFERVIGDQVHLCFHSLVKQMSIILGEN